MVVTSQDGLELEVQQDGPLDSVPLVFLHGFAMSAEEFGWLAAQLAERHRVVRPSFRGHGDSDRAAGPYLGPDYVADAVAVLEQATEVPALLVGHSLGGVVALAVAQQRPDLVRALLVVDPAIVVAEEIAPGEPINVEGLRGLFQLIHSAIPHVQASGVSVGDFAEQLLAAPTLHGVSIQELYVDEFARWWASSQLRLDVRVLNPVVDPAAARERVPFDIDRPVDVPTLAILADPAMPDALVSSALRERLEAAGSPNLETVVIEGAGHNLQDERLHRATFLAHFGRWLDDHA